jgi:hypothetical protein
MNAVSIVGRWPEAAPIITAETSRRCRCSAGGGSVASIRWIQIKAGGRHALRMLEAIRYD